MGWLKINFAPPHFKILEGENMKKLKCLIQNVSFYFSLSSFPFRKIAICLLLGLLLPCWSAVSDVKEIVVTESDNDKVISLGSDNSLVIKLPGLPSTGFYWSVIKADPEYIQDVSSINDTPEFIYLNVVNDKPVPGTPCLQVLRFLPLKEGTVNIKAIYSQPWDKSREPARTFSLTVNMEGGVTRALEKKLALAIPEKKEKAFREDVVYTPGLPAQFDWRDHGIITPVKKQTNNTCWSFGATAAFEAAIKKKTGVTKDLSEQYLVNCNPYGFTAAGGGWWAYDLFEDYVAYGDEAAGAVYESDLPYTGTDDKPNLPYKHYEQIEEWGYIDKIEDDPWPKKTHQPTTAQIKQALYDYGPIATNIYSSNWGKYTGGVFTDENKQGNHIVLITGWDDSQKCFFVKNSWGDKWGENGYIRIAYNSCDIGDCATYVSFKKTNPRLVYGGNKFMEDYRNDGTIHNSIKVRLVDTGTGKLAVTSTPMQEGVHYRLQNVPQGLKAEVKAQGDKTLFISLKGSAQYHTNSNDVSNISVILYDAAFVNITTSQIENNIKEGLKADFYDPFEIKYEDLTDITINTTNKWKSFRFANGKLSGGLWYMGYNSNWPNDPQHYTYKLETYQSDAVCYGTTMPGILIPMTEGTVIGPATKNWCRGGSYGKQHTITGPNHKNWNGKTAYTGARYKLEGREIYVWFRIKVTSDGKTITLYDLAYNEDPMGTIKAGQKDSGSSSGYSPIAKFTYTIQGKKVSFFNASNDPDGQITGNYWTFGDNNTSNTKNPVHTYANYGTYQVNLRVTDNDGKTGSYSQTIVISDPNGSDYITKEAEPNNRSSNANGPVGNNIAFTGSVARSDYNDWFFLNVTKTSTLNIQSTFSSTDCSWQLYHESNLTKSVAWKGSGAYTAQPGKYYLLVYTWQNGGTYSVKVTALSGGSNSNNDSNDSVQEWNQNQKWYEYKVGDRRKNAGKLWECKNTAWAYYEPSGPYGHYSWTFIKDYQ